MVDTQEDSQNKSIEKRHTDTYHYENNGSWSVATIVF